MAKFQMNTDSAPLPPKTSRTGVFKVPMTAASDLQLKTANVRLDLKTCRDLSAGLTRLLPYGDSSLVTRAETSRISHESQNSKSQSDIESLKRSEKEKNLSQAEMSVDMNSSFMENISFLSDMTDFSFTMLLEETSKREDSISETDNDFQPETNYATLTLATAVDVETAQNHLSRSNSSQTPPLPCRMYFNSMTDHQHFNRERHTRDDVYNSQLLSTDWRVANYQNNHREYTGGYDPTQSGYNEALTNLNVQTTYPRYAYTYGCDHTWRHPHYQEHATENHYRHHCDHYIQPYSRTHGHFDGNQIATFPNRSAFRDSAQNLPFPQVINHGLTALENVKESLVEPVNLPKEHESNKSETCTNSLSRETIDDLQRRNVYMEDKKCPESNFHLKEGDQNESVADVQHKGSSKRQRLSYSKEQISELEKQFRDDPYPTRTPLMSLSEKLKIPIKHLIYWFQNRRMKEKKIRSKNDSNELPF